MTDKIFWFFIVSLSLILFVEIDCYSQQNQPGKSLNIHFLNYVENDRLILDSAVYKNNSGQTYTVSKFKYYIGSVILTANDNSEFISSGYHLINEEDEISKEIHLQNVPEKYYTKISFIIGVDSIHNCSGVQSGDLDPVKGMFWAWNTGYIFLKLEGNSPQSTSAAHMIEYHIGGFQKPNNCIRKVTLDLDRYCLSKGLLKISMIDIKADISEIFKNPISLDFSKMPVITDFHNAITIADNYMDMFSILEVK